MDAAGKLSAAFTHRRRGEAEEAERPCREIPGAGPGASRASWPAGAGTSSAPRTSIAAARGPAGAMPPRGRRSAAGPPLVIAFDAVPQ